MYYSEQWVQATQRRHDAATKESAQTFQYAQSAHTEHAHSRARRWVHRKLGGRRAGRDGMTTLGETTGCCVALQKRGMNRKEMKPAGRRAQHALLLMLLPTSF